MFLPSLVTRLFVIEDTENYATEMEQLTPVGDMSNPKDQFGTFITAVILFGNVILKL